MILKMAEIFNWDFKQKSLRVADLDVLLSYSSENIERKIQSYICEEKEKYDVVIQLDEQKLRGYAQRTQNTNFDLCEYMLTGSIFYTALMDYEGFMLHSSAVVYDGKAYLFSAPCGTGKSTHTSLWCEYFGAEAFILNDDKPALRFIGDELIAYGTPWSGKTDKQKNVSAPVAGIAFIEQAEENSIERLDPKTALLNIFSQTVRPGIMEKMDNLAVISDKLLKTVPVYALKCNMETDAVKVAYEAMKR